MTEGVAELPERAREEATGCTRRIVEAHGP